jgi:hypothetical protein
MVPVTVYECIDAVADAETANRFLANSEAFHTVTVGSESFALAQPVVYHDAAAELLALVLPPGLRHRELAERISLLQRLASDNVALPNYVRDFVVVIGSDGLRAHLEAMAESTLQAQRLAEREKQLTADVADLTKRYETAQAEALRARTLVDTRSTEIAQLEQKLAALNVTLKEERARTIETARHDVVTAVENPVTERVVAVAATELAPAPVLPAAPAAPVVVATPAAVPPVTTSRGPTTGVDSKPIRALTALHHAAPASPPLDSHQVDVVTLPVEPSAAWLRAAVERKTDRFFASAATEPMPVRLALAVSPNSPLLSGDFDVRIVMPRVDGYPIIALTIGEGAAGTRAVLPFDLSNELDASIIQRWGSEFGFRMAVIATANDGSETIARVCDVKAPLAENVGYMLRAAREELAALPAAKRAAGAAKARQTVLADGFDLLGYQHPEFAEFREDKLRSIQTASSVRRALAIARRFAKPSREDYLFCTRGYPLVQWRALRRDLLAAATQFGLWMGPELAQIAVSEGLARSRRDLVVRLDAGFSILRKNLEAFDLDDEAASDNLEALGEEAQARGVTLKRAPLDSDPETMQAAGFIEGRAPAVNAKSRSVAELLTMLDDRLARVAAAIELCERGEGRAAAAVIASVRKMNRSEAVRVLGMCVRFGNAAAPALQEGLSNSKSYLRHGCALALAMLRTDDGTVAVIDLLLSEPTEIWREIARAIGQIGTAALTPLAQKIGALGDHVNASARERSAWAMAHIAVRGGKAALTTMASGQSVVAPVAARALELLPMAARDQVRIAPDATGSAPGREVTVNRAFSRRFFESLDVATPAAQPAVVDLDAAGALESLADEDVIHDGDLLDDEDAMEISDADLLSP